MGIVIGTLSVSMLALALSCGGSGGGENNNGLCEAQIYGQASPDMKPAHCGDGCAHVAQDLTDAGDRQQDDQGDYRQEYHPDVDVGSAAKAAHAQSQEARNEHRVLQISEYADLGGNPTDHSEFEK